MKSYSKEEVELQNAEESVDAAVVDENPAGNVTGETAANETTATAETAQAAEVVPTSATAGESTADGNLTAAETTDQFSAKELAVTLIRNNNILIKDCSYKKGFEDVQYVRIAIRNRADNDALIDALKAL